LKRTASAHTTRTPDPLQHVHGLDPDRPRWPSEPGERACRCWRAQAVHPGGVAVFVAVSVARCIRRSPSDVR
jgi:hypothetical protein